MKEDFFFLRSKADRFMVQAKHAIDEAHYDMAALNIEQAAQLYIKFTLGITAGEFPRTHNIEELLISVYDVLKLEEIKTILEKDKKKINTLYKSYFESRYFDEPFELSEVTEMLELVNRITGILQKTWG